MSETIEQSTTIEGLGTVGLDAVGNLNPWSLTMEQATLLRDNFPSFCAVSGVPESLFELLQRYASLYRSAFGDFWRELHHFQPTEEEALARVDERVTNRIEECWADDVDSFLDWCFTELTRSEAEFAAHQVEQEAAASRVLQNVFARLAQESKDVVKEAQEAIEGQPTPTQ